MVCLSNFLGVLIQYAGNEFFLTSLLDMRQFSVENIGTKNARSHVRSLPTEIKIQLKNNGI